MYQAGIYCRVSIEEQNKEGEYSNSIHSQIQMARDYIAEQNDITEVRVYVDDGFSGSNFDRTEFRRMLADIELRTINMVIFKDIETVTVLKDAASAAIYGARAAGGVMGASMSELTGVESLKRVLLVADGDYEGKVYYFMGSSLYSVSKDGSSKKKIYMIDRMLDEVLAASRSN